MDFLYYRILAMPTIIGIVIIESNVVRETPVAESAVSAPNFSENIVVAAANGAAAAIVHAVSTTPVIPKA